MEGGGCRKDRPAHDRMGTSVSRKFEKLVGVPGSTEGVMTSNGGLKKISACRIARAQEP